MFISNSQLKKLMKKDYKDKKITIGNIDGGYSIMGNNWIVHIRHDGMPNIVKSLIIELTGVLPEEGDILTVSKENPIPQYGTDTDSIHVLRRYQKSGRPAFLTNVYEEFYDDLYGLIQSNIDGKLCRIRKELLDLVDLNAIIFEIEDLPGNPCYGTEMSSGIIWHNGTTTLLLLPGGQESQIADTLKDIIFDPYLDGFLEEDKGCVKKPLT